LIDPGVNVQLSASVSEKGFALRKVRFYDGDKLLGEAVSAPWQATWEKPARGAHAVLAEYEGADGKPGASRPALVIVRQAASVAK